MTWIRLDPQELVRAGIVLRDAGATLVTVQARIRQACCAPGLGQPGASLMGEGEALATRIVTMTEGYLRLAIDILQRAIATARENQLVSSVGGVGLIGAVVGGSAVGGTGPAFVGGFRALSDTSGNTVAAPGAYGPGIVGGGASGLSPLTVLVANRQASEAQRLAAMRSGPLSPAGLNNQTLTNMNNRAMMQSIANSETRIAANSPIAGIGQLRAADATDQGGRVAKFDLDEFYAKKDAGRL